jgi:hypothetical protein
MPNPYPNLFVAIDAFISTPNSSEGRAIIIASLISVGGIVLVQFFNWLQSRSQRKKDSSERAFYEVFPKRLAAYEEAIKRLEAMIENGKSLMNLSLTEEAAYDRISNDKHDLNDLYTRIRMFGSARTIIIFTLLIAEASNELAILYNEGDYVRVALGRWIDAVREAFEDFILAVRKDTGGNFVDKMIASNFPETKENCIKRIKDKLFPSQFDKAMQKADKIREQIEEILQREKNGPKND